MALIRELCNQLKKRVQFPCEFLRSLSKLLLKKRSFMCGFLKITIRKGGFFIFYA